MAATAPWDRLFPESQRRTQEISIVAGIDMRTEQKNDYPVFASLNECKVEADVVIDFSNAAAVDELLDWCAEKKMPVVLCTTGLSEVQPAKVEETAEKTAVLRSANMSLGINMLLKLLKEAAQILAPAGFDIEILEKHHNQKVDAPSGTAIALARFDQRGDGKYSTITVTIVPLHVRNADAKEIGIQAIPRRHNRRRTRCHFRRSG